MNENERLHHILNYMASHGIAGQGWDATDLMKAFNYQLSIDEIERLCGILIKDGVVGDATDKDGISIMFNQETKNALFSQLYLKKHQPFRRSPSPPTESPLKPELPSPKIESNSWIASIKLAMQKRKRLISVIVKIIKAIFWLLGSLLTLYGISQLFLGFVPSPR